MFSPLCWSIVLATATATSSATPAAPPPAPAGAACTATLPGMRCLDGGPLVVGEGELARSVTVPRVLVDEVAVTFGDFQRCVDAGACVALAEGKPGKKRAALPALVDWPRAEHYCAFAGKRLPSEAEWQRAASSSSSSSAPPSSEGAAEWTNTWAAAPPDCAVDGSNRGTQIARASKSTWFPPAICGSVDPLDACDGAVLCGTLQARVVKEPAHPAARKKAAPWDDAAKHAFRCATSTTYLTRFPPRPLAPKEAPALPQPPSADEVRRFSSIVEDVLDTPKCETPGRSFIDCRDPRSYLKTNEPKLGVVLPYVENLGGGYTGVASDQNYTLIAHARSQWVWLFDYDENVVRWHRVLRALILAADDRKAFLALFATPAGHAAAVAAVRAAYPSAPAPEPAPHAGDKNAKRPPPTETDNLVALFARSAGSLFPHYQRQALDPSMTYTWLGSDEHYEWIRTLYAQGRMAAFKGNMLAGDTMRTVGDAARALGVPMRIYYPSNAAEFWVFSDQYRKNVRGLPFDDKSVVVQTISSVKTGFGQTGYWHYNVQYGFEQQALIASPGMSRLKQLLAHRTKSESTELTLCGLPSD